MAKELTELTEVTTLPDDAKTITVVNGLIISII